MEMRVFIFLFCFKKVMKREKPRVALLNIGAEEEKGTDLIKESYAELKNCNKINFIDVIYLFPLFYFTIYASFIISILSGPPIFAVSVIRSLLGSILLIYR